LNERKGEFKLKNARPLVGLLIVSILIVITISYGVATQSISPKPTSSPVPTPTPSQPNSSIPPSISPTLTIPAPTPTPSPPLLMQETVRDSVMNYIKANHVEITQFIGNLVWTGGRVTQADTIGAETYMYYAGGWNFTITYPVIPQPAYTIIADYKTSEIGIPYRIIWQGSWENQVIKETYFVFAQ
jgi:hypothetical protein